MSVSVWEYKHTIRRSKNIPCGITNKGRLEYANYLQVVTEVLLSQSIYVKKILLFGFVDLQTGYRLYDLQEGDTADLLTQCTRLILWDVLTLALPRFSKVCHYYSVL